MKVDPHRRFWTHVDKTDTCWLWTGAVAGGDYGRFALTAHHMVQAHRWSYEQWHGPLPDGLVLDHLCRVHRCVNPAHLEPVANRENILRGVGLSAINRQKTHCKRGHEFTVANTQVWAGQRRCRRCGTLSKRKPPFSGDAVEA